MALSACSWGMVRQKADTLLLPRARAQINSSTTRKVTVFSPPAVEPEEPPMSISTMETALPPWVSPA